MKGRPPPAAKGFALYKRAAELLREVIKKKDNIALINEANFRARGDPSQSSRRSARNPNAQPSTRKLWPPIGSDRAE